MRGTAAAVTRRRSHERALHTMLVKKYGFDELYQRLFASGSRGLGKLFWKAGDQTIIDGLVVNGSARSVGWLSSLVRWIQTGRLYSYAFSMIIGLIALLGVVVWR